MMYTFMCNASGLGIDFYENLAKPAYLIAAIG